MDMSTLYIRDVPPEVVETLKVRAAQQGQSLSAYAGAQLTALARRPDNADIVERLRARSRPSDVTPKVVLDELAKARL